MISVVHLLAQELDDQTSQCARSLMGSAPRGTIASVIHMTGPSLRAAALAAKEIRRTTRGYVIHAWGRTALSVGILSGRSCVVYTPQPALALWEIRWLRLSQAYRTVHVLCQTEYQRRALIQAGFNPERCHLVRPGADCERLQRPRNTAVRAALGFSEEDQVILAMGESTPATEHRRVVWAVAILHVLDPRYRVLLWGRGPAWPALQRFAQRLGSPNLLRIAQQTMGREVEYEELLAAADVAVHAGTEEAGVLPIVTTMAAGVPIVAVASHSACELLENRQTAILVPDASPQRLAEQVLQLTEDPILRHSLSERAKADALARFSLSRYAEQHACLYEQLAAGNTEVQRRIAAGVFSHLPAEPPG